VSTSVKSYKYTQDELQRVLGITAKLALVFLEPLNMSCVIAEVQTKEQACMYLAQLGHESGGFRYTKEIYGPTKQQLKYELPNALAKRLGNARVGDGKRFIGHGLIQVTGRYNHKMITQEMRKYISNCPDFEANPELLGLPFCSILSSTTQSVCFGLTFCSTFGLLIRLRL